MNLEDRMKRSITQRQSVVVLRSEFAQMGSAAQVGRVLNRLVDDGKLIKVSKGAFAKTRINKFTGKPMPDGTLEAISAELFGKLGIEVAPSRLVEEYNSGQSTQIPMTSIVNTGQRRISRKVTVGNRSIAYENHAQRAQV